MEAEEEQKRQEEEHKLQREVQRRQEEEQERQEEQQQQEEEPVSLSPSKFEDEGKSLNQSNEVTRQSLYLLFAHAFIVRATHLRPICSII